MGATGSSSSRSASCPIRKRKTTTFTSPSRNPKLCRRVVLGYVSYALNRVGEVAASAADVDTIMSYGFNWAPPTAIVDLLGAKNTVAMLEKLKLPVPATVEQAAASDAKMFAGGVLKYGRTFVG